MHAQIESLLDELSAMARFRWIAVGVAWGVGLLGWAFVASIPNSYEATARVYVDASSALRPLLQGLAVDAPVDAQLNFVRQEMLSRPALARVADETDIALRAKTPEAKQRLVDALGEQISITLAPSVEKTQDKLYVITYQDPKRDTAYAVVKTLLNAFVEGSMGAGREGSETAQRFLREQIAEYERRLSDAENRLADFKRKNVGLMPGEQGDFFTRLQAQLEAIKRAQASLTIALNRREALARQLRGEQPYSPSAAPAGALGAAGVRGAGSDTGLRLKDAQTRLQELLLRFTDKHPEVVALRETIAQLERRQREEIEALQRGDATAALTSGLSANPVYQSIQMQLNQADVEVAALRGEINDRQNTVAELQRLRNLAPEVEAELARLNRDYGITKAQYEALVDRLEKARLSEQATETGTVKFEVIDPPVAKFEPVSPKRGLLSTAVLAAALAAGVGVAWMLHQLRPVYTATRQLVDETGLAVLGSVSKTWSEHGRARAKKQAVYFAAAAAGLIAVYAVTLLYAANKLPFGAAA